MTGFGGQTSFTYHCFNVKMYLLKIVGTAYKVRLVRRVHMAKKVIAFFQGFVLGLMVDQTENYIITSNRESGFGRYGRYDIMLEPIDKTNEKLPGIVIEFKVINQRKENSLEETVAAALKQIEEKN